MPHNTHRNRKRGAYEKIRAAPCQRGAGGVHDGICPSGKCICSLQYRGGVPYKIALKNGIPDLSVVETQKIGEEQAYFAGETEIWSYFERGNELTIHKNALVSLDGQTLACQVTNAGTMLGGTFNESVKLDCFSTTNGGTFLDSVYVIGATVEDRGNEFFRATIEDGSFSGNVSNRGLIQGGTFQGRVENN